LSLEEKKNDVFPVFEVEHTSGMACWCCRVLQCFAVCCSGVAGALQDEPLAFLGEVKRRFFKG